MENSQSERAATCAATTGGWDSAGTTNPSSPLDDPKFDLRFCCFDNATYHAARAGYFDRMHRIFMGVVLLSSSAAISSLAFWPMIAPWAPLISIIPVVVSTLDLVVAPGTKAQAHTTLRARYFELLADVEESNLSPENCKRWQAALHRTSAGEPPVVYRAIKANAYNSAVDMLLSETEAEKRRLSIPFCHWVFASVWPFHSASYRPIVRK